MNDIVRQPLLAMSAADVVAPRVHKTDVAIIGGGLAGSLAAVVLGRAGHSVALIDRHAEYPEELRVEKLAGTQVELMRRLGLLDCIAAKACRYDQVVNVRHGRVIDRSYGEQYGIMYADLVATVRAQIPPSVPFIVDRVVELQTGPEQQRIRLSNQGMIEARLIVLATGMADVLRHQLGIRRRTVHEKHSISFGFSIVPAARATFPFPALTCYGDKPSDRIDYLNLFPIGAVMRANLFTYLDHRDPWVRTLRREPKQALLAAMPGLAHFLGDFAVIDQVQNWTMDLQVVENFLRDGVVLVGDAFQTSCPAAGTGVTRLLTDVDRLCNGHVPRWLTTSGMTRDKIAAFYADPAKRRADAHAARLADYRRVLTINDGLAGDLRRHHAFLRRRLLGWIRRRRRVPAVHPMPAATLKAVAPRA